MFKLNHKQMDWVDVKNKCRTTVNKEHNNIEPSNEFKTKLLISEHSPIRLLKLNFRFENIKSWVATHYSRHHIGWEKWISTQRTDRTGINRDNIKQSELVNMDIEANAQALINVAKVRLCYKASQETREEMERLKNNLYFDTETRELSNVLVPSCIYRNGCPEFDSCNLFDKFIKDKSKEDLCNIEKRYKHYEEFLYDK